MGSGIIQKAYSVSFQTGTCLLLQQPGKRKYMKRQAAVINLQKAWKGKHLQEK